MRTNVANEVGTEMNLVQLTVPTALTSDFTVTVSGVKDTSGNAMASTTVSGKLIKLSSTDIGSPAGQPGGPDPQGPSSVILGERGKGARVEEAIWLETTVFLNRGGRFEAVLLPGEAQYAPAFGVSVGDIDGDGQEDIFLSQIFFGVEEETSRYDAGRAVWLRGDGRGQFAVVPGQVSGVKVYGEGRGSALCDYDGDGRVDLVVGQNGAETKLYHNVGARPGLRLRLVGPAGNPTGVGAVVRLRFGERWGHAREIHAGGGYWSQDSAVQVLGTIEPPTAVSVRWPGGKIEEVAVQPGAKEMTVTLTGNGKGR